MKIEQLVPDLELCKQIPDGEFEDSAFCWRYVWQTGFICRKSGCQQNAGWVWQVEQCNAGRLYRGRERGEQIFPAPTLQEIIEAINRMPDVFTPTAWIRGENWIADCVFNKTCEVDRNGFGDVELNKIEIMESKDENAALA